MRSAKLIFFLFILACAGIATAAFLDSSWRLGMGFKWTDGLWALGIGAWGSLVYLLSRAVLSLLSLTHMPEPRMSELSRSRP